MEIEIKVGDVEIKLVENTNATDYPKITSANTHGTHDVETKSRVLLDGVKELADKAAEINIKIHAWER